MRLYGNGGVKAYQPMNHLLCLLCKVRPDHLVLLFLPLLQKPMNHLHRVADWVAELGAAAGTAGGGEGAQQARQDRIPNPVDLRVYAVTDPDCNAKWDRGNAGGASLCVFAVDRNAWLCELVHRRGHATQPTCLLGAAVGLLYVLQRPMSHCWSACLLPHSHAAALASATALASGCCFALNCPIPVPFWPNFHTAL